MAMEVSCGQCNGRLLIETPGVVVACPHCGVHLSIPLPESEAEASPPTGPADDVQPQSSPPEAASSPSNFVEPSVETIPPSSPPSMPAPAAVTPQSPSSIFHVADTEPSEPNRLSDIGWPSSPNLSLEGASESAGRSEEKAPHSVMADTGIAGPNFNWMAAPPSSSTPDAVPSLSFGAPAVAPAPVPTPAVNPVVEPQSPAQFGWPSSPNLSLTDQSESNPVVVESAPASVPSPASTPAGASGVPDFSWLQATNSPPPPASPPQFSFGMPPAANDVPARSSPTAEIPAPAMTFPGGLQASSATSPVLPQSPQINIPAQPFFPQPANEPAAREAYSPPAASSPVGSWGGPTGASPSPSQPFNLGNSSAPAPSRGFDLSSFGTASAAASHSTDTFSPIATRQSVETPMVEEPRREQEAAGQPLIPMILLVVGSYASLVTIYLVYMTILGRKHQLESLPDLKTVQQLGGRASVPRPENILPPGHELKLGQSERFGNIRVTALRVTREPIVFKHFSGDPRNSRDPTEPVLKLWLKFENVAGRQTITPLDTTLMFFNRVVDDHVASFNVIFRDADRTNRKAQFYYPFDRMSDESEWTMVGQHTNEALAPGESFETYIPSQEHTEELTGSLVWRVHIRKGYGPSTGNGVTTLIDVRFNSDEIKPAAA